MTMHACTGVANLQAYQDYHRSVVRSTRQPRPDKQFETRADLLNWMRDQALPPTVDEMDSDQLYAVSEVADIWNDMFPDVLGCGIVSKRCIEFMGQLIALGHAWALHGDGKHKLHHGRWVLTTFGTHSLVWDRACKTYRHSFRPLLYFFSREVESISAVRLAMVAMQISAVHFFGSRLKPAVTISDHSDGLRSGMHFANVDHLASQEEQDATPTTPHMSDWAHIATHYTQGKLVPKAHPYYDEVYFLLLCLHLTHTSEMKNLLQAGPHSTSALIHHTLQSFKRMQLHTLPFIPHSIYSVAYASIHTTFYLFSCIRFNSYHILLIQTHSLALQGMVITQLEEWIAEIKANNGGTEGGSYSLSTLIKAHLTPPWDTFSIGTYDTVGDTIWPELPCILPSNQCQESWHGGITRTFKGKMRGATDAVLQTTLPKLLFVDAANMPKQLIFTPDAYVSPFIIRKALTYIERGSKAVALKDNVIFVARTKGKCGSSGLTNVAMDSYMDVLSGSLPVKDKEYKKAITHKARQSASHIRSF